MSANSIPSPFPIFTDVDGNPLENGYIYVGEPNLNPEAAPISVYWDSAATIPAAQPIRTLGGYPSRYGAMAVMYTVSDYSITIKNKNGSLVSSSATPTGATRQITVYESVSSLIGYTTAPDKTSVNVQGYTTPNDGGGGIFNYDASIDKSTADGGRTIDPSVSLALQGTGIGTGAWVSQQAGAVNPKEYGVVGDGITDDKINFKRALSSAILNNKDLEVNDNYYLVASGIETVLPNINNIKIFGTGKITIEGAVLSEAFNGLIINGDNVTIDGVTIKFISDVSGTVGIYLTNGSKGKILNCDLSTSSLEPHIMLLADDAVANNWIINNNYFHDFNFGIFTNNLFGANNNGGHAYDWRITDNLFEGMQRDALEFNSNDLETTPGDRPWRRIIIDSNIFKNRTTGPISSMIGCDSVSDLTITNNLFENCTVLSYTSVVHIENAGGNCVISNNGFDNVYRGIEVYHDSDNFIISDNRINGLSHYDNATLVSSMTFSGTDSAGIEVISAGEVANNISITGNLITNFKTGIFVPIPNHNIKMSDNTVLFCNTGLNIGGEYQGILDSNLIGNCITGIELKSGHNNIGKNTFANCNSVVLDSQLKGKTILNGIVVEYTNTVAMPLATVIQNTIGSIPLFELPLKLEGVLSINAFTPTNDLNFTVSLANGSYDGATMTTSIQHVINSGSVATNTSPLLQDATHINVRIFQNVAVDAEIQIRADLNGVLFY